MNVLLRTSLKICLHRIHSHSGYALKMSQQVVFIDEDRVKSLLNWEDTFQAVEAALKASSTGNAVQNPRSFTKCANSDNNTLLTMPGHLLDEKFGALGCKLVTTFEGNSKKTPPLPSILANIVLLDDVTGQLKAIIAATEITTWRTAAASVVATKHLHLSKKSGKTDVLAVFGAGTQGRIHAIAFQHFFKFKQVRLWNRTKETAQKLAKELNEISNSEAFRAYENVQECAEDADVIVTATFTQEPLVKLEFLKRNAHINAVGAGMENLLELDVEVYKSAELYCDHLEGTRSEFSTLASRGIEFGAEIGDVIAGKVKPAFSDGITVFQSIGMAVEDCAMARLIYDQHMHKIAQ